MEEEDVGGAGQYLGSEKYRPRDTVDASRSSAVLCISLYIWFICLVAMQRALASLAISDL